MINVIKQRFDCQQCTRWNEETQCCPPIKAGYRVFEVKNECLQCKFYQTKKQLEQLKLLIGEKEYEETTDTRRI